MLNANGSLPSVGVNVIPAWSPRPSASAAIREPVNGYAVTPISERQINEAREREQRLRYL